MLQYNRFWHFWFQLNNRHYSRAFLVTLAIFIAMIVLSALVFPPLWGAVIAFPLVVSGTFALFTALSNFFYNEQNKRLLQIQSETENESLKEQVSLYINRRVICPEELLKGKLLSLNQNKMGKNKSEAQAPLVVEMENELCIQKQDDLTVRNTAYRIDSGSDQLYVKRVAAKNGLSEVAAREMAEILGFRNLIPSNNIQTDKELRFANEIGGSYNHTPKQFSTDLILSRQKIKSMIDKRIQESSNENIKNTHRVQNAVAKFLFNLKTATYRTKIKQDDLLKLLHIQKFIPETINGVKFFTLLFNEPVTLPWQPQEPNEKDLTEGKEQREHAKNLLEKLSLSSFQENFLLHLILGSQDANPGNTLFAKDSGSEKFILYSIDHESIMPEDNYNVTKKIPLVNGELGNQNAVEKDIENVFPIRLWLAGLPQANVPFSRKFIENTLSSLSYERLLSYHQHKKLFSSAAVGAQLERVLLIRKIFEDEIEKSELTLTPKELFLRFINDHPTYLFLKNEFDLSDFSTFMLLGQVPEGADVNILRHPLQYFPIIGMSVEAEINSVEGKPFFFSEESFRSPHAHNYMFFSMVLQQKMCESANQSGLDVLNEVSVSL